MRAKPYLYSLLTAVIGIGFLLSKLAPIPPTIQLDPRLSPQLATELTGFNFNLPKMPVLAGFDFGIPISIAPPVLSVGFDSPAWSMKKALIRRKNYQLVAPFSSFIDPLSDISDVEKTFGDTNILTDDELVYARFKGELKKLVFEKDSKKVLEALRSADAIALISTDKVTANIKIISTVIPISIWAGWKEARFPFSAYLRINDDLKNSLRILLQKVEIQSDHSDLESIVAVGDLMLARRIGEKITKQSHLPTQDYPFGKILGVLQQADITIGNLECAISKRGAALAWKDYTFRAHPNVIPQLTQAGFDIVTLANNHSRDYGTEAFLDTLTNLEAVGIQTIGGGKNRDEARQFKVLATKSGTRVGFLGYTMIIPKTFVASGKSPGVVWGRDKNLVKDIQAARKECDVLMVQFHWGREYEMKPTEDQRALAYKTIDAGADIVVGHHPHWIQEVEFYKDKFIAYSLGNFVFDMNHRPKVTEGLLLTCEIKNKKIHQIHLDPIKLESGAPQIISPEMALKRDRKIILKELFTASGL